MSQAQSDVENIQPPSETVELLQNSSESNAKTQANFNDLLRIPFLQEIRAGSLNPNTGKDSIPILHTISEGLTCFSSSQITDVNIVRKLSAFSATVPRLAAALPRSRLAEVLEGMVTRYAEFANKKSVQTKQFHTKFATVISNTSTAIDELDADLDILREEIEAIEDEGDEEPLFGLFSVLHSNSGTKLLETTARRLRKYLVEDVNSEQSLVSTLSLLFSTTSEDLAAILRGEEEQPDIEKFLKLLNDFQGRIRDVRLLMTSLLDNMRYVLRQSVCLMSTWYILLQQLETLAASETGDELFDEDEQGVITEAWGNLKADADAFTASVSDASVSAVNTVLERNTEIVRRSLAFTPRSAEASNGGEVDISSEQNEALSKLTTDEQTTSALESMTATSGKIVASFNNLLRVPFLDSLHVSAAVSTGASKDGKQETEEEENNDIDLETLTLNFLQRYQKLQADTVPIARNLFSYATLQQRLIPMLNSSLSIENYVRVNLRLIEARREEAEKVHAAHNKFQQDWNTAILLVERAIAEQEANIDGLEATIDDLIAQKKRKTLGAILSFIGAALFTAAAVFSGGILFALCGAAAVGCVVTGTKLSIEAAQLQQGINGFKAALKTAKETLSNLKFVLPIMIEVREQLTSVTLIWNDIANNLTDLATGTEAWEILAFTLQGDEWGPFLEAALESWKAIEKAVLAYVAQVSDVNPTIE